MGGDPASDFTVVNQSPAESASMQSLAQMVSNNVHFSSSLEPDVVKYMLFVKSPPPIDEKKTRAEKAKMSGTISEKEK